MSTSLTVSSLQAKSHASPDETRTPPKTRVEVVRLEGYTIGRFNFEPGWRWSECVKPVVGTESCQNAHVGYAVSGQEGIGSRVIVTRHARNHWTGWDVSRSSPCTESARHGS